MRPGAVLVDIAIDQGGCFETSRPTTHADPVYHDEGVVHYAVTNMPGAVPRTATLALTNATIPHVRSLARLGWRQAIQHDPHLRDGLNVSAGRIRHPAVAQAIAAAEEAGHAQPAVETAHGRVAVRGENPGVAPMPARRPERASVIRENRMSDPVLVVTVTKDADALAAHRNTPHSLNYWNLLAGPRRQGRAYRPAIRRVELIPRPDGAGAPYSTSSRSIPTAVSTALQTADVSRWPRPSAIAELNFCRARDVEIDGRLHAGGKFRDDGCIFLVHVEHGPPALAVIRCGHHGAANFQHLRAPRALREYLVDELRVQSGPADRGPCTRQPRPHARGQGSWRETSSGWRCPPRRSKSWSR